MKQFVPNILTITEEHRRFARRWLSVLQIRAECELCFDDRSEIFSGLCLSCLKKGVSNRWSGCSRCGIAECGSTCGVLPKFSSVNSIFQYSGFHRELLLRAKDMQDPVAICAFNQIYSDPVRTALDSIFRTEEISLVVIPRLSLGRILGLNWHPADFWINQLRIAQNQQHSLQKFTILMLTPRRSGRRAKVSSKVRRQQVAEFSIAQEFDVDAHIKPDMTKHKSILLVDDVMTSGGTLLDELDAVQTHLATERASDCTQTIGHGLLLPLRLNAHILTLFRTPAPQKKRG